ncbi:hypothetical protein [Paracoccus tibetensis]|uniref:Uncharacterized protein n=1 Tax=Paracoccus tibetensis TaxID=336292 RepID=A0A1G5K4T1_9RHOB|nr:hypothetical protein [Paracoccus tibetensis]SCY95546.1 hypothetical protein SAMN05660710_03688 [Paracoccus tibetensis]
MTRDEMLTALAPPRLPAEMASLSLSEMLALIAIGTALGLVAGLLLLPLTRRRAKPKKVRLSDLRPLPVPERLLALARLLGHLPLSLRAAAYGAEPPPSDRVIERAARRARPWQR